MLLPLCHGKNLVNGNVRTQCKARLKFLKFWIQCFRVRLYKSADAHLSEGQE